MDGTHGQLRLAELIASLSLATDLGMGQPMEQALRSCLIALALAKRLGCTPQNCSDVYYLALVQHIGCTADAYETARYTGGDEIAFRGSASTIPTGPPKEMLAFMLRHFAEGHPALERTRLVLAMLASGRKRFQSLTAARCEVAAVFSDRLGLSPGVRLGVTEMVERWDGKGGPRGLAGEAISRPARIVQLAHDVEIFERLGGLKAARQEVVKRRGSGFDPAVADAYLEGGKELFSEIPQGSAWEATMAAEPDPKALIPAPDLDRVASALADFVDLKSPYLHGHSSGVSDLADTAARILGCQESENASIRRAGLMHDLGRIGIANGIWQKAGPLTASEFERVRLHPYYTERILSRSTALAPLAPLAGSHHERLDGSGYHRGSAAAQLPVASRILAAADVFQALSEDRPHRPARSATEAAHEVAAEVSTGRLDGMAANAVLQAAGQRPLVHRREWPAGLSEREVEVLRRLCRGETNRQMGSALFISEKTVGHHIEHIYNKIGRATRAGAALFAMEHDLLA